MSHMVESSPALDSLCFNRFVGIDFLSRLEFGSGQWEPNNVPKFGLCYNLTSHCLLNYNTHHMEPYKTKMRKLGKRKYKKVIFEHFILL